MQEILKFFKQYKLGIQSVLIIGFGIFFMLFLGGFLANKIYHNARSDIVDNNATTTVMSKAAVDDLVKKAANQKYLQDVFSNDTKLPVPKHPIPLQPLTTKAPVVAPVSTGTANGLNAQRCSYNGQMYVLGDIVKTDKGWIRCTPTFIFSPDNPTSQQYGNPAWTAVQ